FRSSRCLDYGPAATVAGASVARETMPAPVLAGREAVPALEGFRKRRFGLVADAGRDDADVLVGLVEHPRGAGHAPAREVGQRRLLDELAEARRERRA